MKTVIIKLGGSLLSPYEKAMSQLSQAQIPFDADYANRLIQLLVRAPMRVVLLVGGGFLSRWYVKQMRSMWNIDESSVDDLHTIGIASSVINASTFKVLLHNALGVKQRLFPEILKFHMYEHLDEYREKLEASQFIVASGWKPGHSHDLDAVLFAEYFGESTFYSLKNIDGVYTADPQKDPSAKRLASLTWDEYFSIIKVTEHQPGANYPVDPIAAKESKEKGITCFVMSGTDFTDVERMLHGQMPLQATRIANE
jgi:uridylate kinase